MKPLSELLCDKTRFGRLTVVGEGDLYRGPNGKNRRRARCKCDCGNETDVVCVYLRTGKTKSCGCAVVDAVRVRSVKHGHTVGRKPTPEYRAWCEIVKRCEQAARSNFNDYGGRGIGICESWRSSFDQFYLDVGPRPSPKHSIDRINNNGNYEPGNCKWATSLEQCRNRRSNVWVTIDGETLCLVDAARKYGIQRQTLAWRIRRGWSHEDAAKTPT